MCRAVLDREARMHRRTIPAPAGVGADDEQPSRQTRPRERSHQPPFRPIVGEQHDQSMPTTALASRPARVAAAVATHSVTAAATFVTALLASEHSRFFDFGPRYYGLPDAACGLLS